MKPSLPNSKAKKRLGIYGAGGLGREILETAKQIQALENRWCEIYFIDDGASGIQHETINGCVTLTFDEFLQKASCDCLEIVIGVGEPVTRKALYEKVKSRECNLAVIIHPTVHIPDTTVIKEGVIIQAFALISCNVEIGENTLIQNTASIAHNSKVGKNSVISAYVAISGCCTVGDETYIAVSVPVKEQMTIGSNSIVGMGSVVLRDIPENVIALGNPARPLKNKDDTKVFK